MLGSNKNYVTENIGKLYGQNIRISSGEYFALTIQFSNQYFVIEYTVRIIGL